MLVTALASAINLYSLTFFNVSTHSFSKAVATF